MTEFLIKPTDHSGVCMGCMSRMKAGEDAIQDLPITVDGHLIGLCIDCIRGICRSAMIWQANRSNPALLAQDAAASAVSGAGSTHRESRIGPNGRTAGRIIERC